MPTHVPDDLGGLPVTRIGSIVERGDATVRWRLHGELVELPETLGWEHRE